MKNPFNILIPGGSGLSKIQLKYLPYTWMWLWKKRFGRDFILEIPYGGIGDHLFLSHLPELLVKNGLYDKVYISTHSRYNFPDLYDLVWLSNPYVAGTIRKHGWKNSGLRPEGSNFLDGVVYQFTGNRPTAGSTHPILYHKEQFRKYSDERYYLIDFNRVSNKHKLNTDTMRLYLEQVIRGMKEPVDVIYAYKSPLFDEILEYSALLQKLIEKGLLKVIGKENGRHDYFSRVKHAKHFFHLYSGGALIAAAFDTPTTVFCETRDPAISLDDQEYTETK